MHKIMIHIKMKMEVKTQSNIEYANQDAAWIVLKYRDLWKELWVGELE